MDNKFKSKIIVYSIITFILWFIILFTQPANAHNIPYSNYYKCGNEEISIDNRYVTISGWRMDIVDNNRFERDFKTKNQATIKGHLIIISYNVGSTLNKPLYYIIDRSNLSFQRFRNGKTTSGPCLTFNY